MPEDTIRRSGLTEIEVRKVPIEEFPKCCAICEYLLFALHKESNILCCELMPHKTWIFFNNICDGFKRSDGNDTNSANV